MNETEMVQEQYASFLVRLWRRARPAAVDPGDVWQGEVEHIQSGQRWAFRSPQELWHFLHQQMAEYSQGANGGLDSS